MRLRTATVVDVDALVELESAAFEEMAWSRAAVLHELTAAWRYVVVAQDAGTVVGWGVLLEGEVCDVLRVAVASPARRQGVGRALLAALVTRAGSRTVLLEVAADNPEAHALYASAGFTEIDRRRDYYGGGCDALVLRHSPDAHVYGVPRA